MSEIPNSDNIKKNESILIIENPSNPFSFINYFKTKKENEIIKDKNNNQEFFIYKYDENKYYLINNKPFEINKKRNNNLKEYFNQYSIIIFFYNSEDINYFELIKIFINKNFSSLKGYNSPFIILIENNNKEQKEKDSFIRLVDTDDDNINKDKAFLISKLLCYYYECNINVIDNNILKKNIFNTIIENFQIIKLFKNTNSNMIYKDLDDENKFNMDITIIGKTDKIESIPKILNKNNNSSFDDDDSFSFKMSKKDKKYEILIHKIKLDEIIKEENIINLETHGIIFIYDLENEESFQYIKKYINIILCSLGNIPFIIIGFYSNESYVSDYLSKQKTLNQYMFKKSNIISCLMNINEIGKENNLIFNDILLSLIHLILYKYPIYNYDEFNEPGLFLNEKANLLIEKNKNKNESLSQKLFEEYQQEKIKLFLCSNCLNPLYIDFNESLGLIIFNCLKCSTIPECYNLNEKFYSNQNDNFINYKNYFFDENNKLYNYFCFDCQQQVFTGNDNNHFYHDGKCYDYEETKKLIIIKKEELEKEENLLKEINNKFKIFIEELQNKFNKLYNSKKIINEIKKDMINSLKIAKNNYILIENIRKLKFEKEKILYFEGINEPEDKIKKLFEYISDNNNKKDIYSQTIKNINMNLKRNEKINKNDEEIKCKINDLCSFKYKNKNYICLCLDNDKLNIYDDKMKYITELDLSNDLKGIKSLFSIYNYSKENNNIYITGIGGIKRITINNKINDIKELNNIKINDEYINKDLNFEYYIKLNKDISITTTVDKKILLLINDENKQIMKNDLTLDIIKDKEYEKIISLDKINNNIFSIKFMKVCEEIYKLEKEENKEKDIEEDSFEVILDHPKDNPKNKVIYNNICTKIIEISLEDKFNVKINKSFIFPNNYHILGSVKEDCILIQCNNPFLQNELIIFDINNFTYIKKYKYKDSAFNIGQFFMVNNTKVENINNFILINQHLKMKEFIFLPKNQEIMKLNQNINIYNNDKSINDKKEEIDNIEIKKIMQLNRNVIGIRGNNKNENKIFILDIN